MPDEPNMAKKPQIDSEKMQELLANFTKELSETYDTKKVLVFGAVQIKVKDETDEPQLVILAMGEEEINFEPFSFQLFKLLGKIFNLYELNRLKKAAQNMKAENE